MKSIFTSSLLALALFALLGVAACKKDGNNPDGDTTAPEVSLLGDPTMSISLNGTFMDAGATALDETDGDLTSSIVVISTIDATTEGAYTVKYSATDAAGNTGQATRNVNVAIMRDNYLGDFTTTNDCPFDFPIGGSQLIEAGSLDNEINFTNFDGVFGSITATVSGTTVSVPSQTLGLNTVVGGGTFSSDASTLTMSFTYSNLLGGSTCAVTYTRE